MTSYYSIETGYINNQLKRYRKTDRPESFFVRNRKFL